MLRSLNDLERYKVTATDGEVGSVADFLLDDRAYNASAPDPAAEGAGADEAEPLHTGWAVRYLVVQTGGLFDRRRVLISPISFREVDAAAKRFHLALSVERIKKSPNLDTNRPVSRQDESEYLRYYQYPYYWDHAGLWGMGMYPGLLATGVCGEKEQTEEPFDDGGLRSAKDLVGFHVEASDGRVGHLEDFLVDDATYEVRYLIVNTGNVGLGDKVRLAPPSADRVRWDERKIYLGMPRLAVLHRDASATPAVLTDGGDSRVARETAGAATGAVTGAILGSIGGPAGVAAGVVLGGLAGAVAEAAIELTAEAEAAHTRELDAQIGVNGGDLGAPNLKHPAPKRAAYADASVGVDRMAADSPAEGPIPPPER